MAAAAEVAVAAVADYPFTWNGVRRVGLIRGDANDPKKRDWWLDVSVGERDVQHPRIPCVLGILEFLAVHGKGLSAGSQRRRGSQSI